MKTALKGFSLVLCSAFALNAFADESPSGIGLGVKAGTAGYGVELSFPVSETMNIRGTMTKFSVDDSMTENDISYDASMTLGNSGLLADWFPFEGNFRLSTGLIRNTSHFDLKAKPSASGYTINNKPYESDQVESLTGKVTFSKSPAPYLGMGWGNAASGTRLGISADIGVILQHAPTTQLDVQCGPALPEVDCTVLRKNVQAAQVQLDDALKKWKAYPVLSLGLTFRF